MNILPARHHFPDHARTTRQYAGEAFEDTMNWPGLVLIGVGLVFVAATLTAAGYGFAGWALIAGILCGICLVGGIGLVALEHRHIRTKDKNEMCEWPRR
ncbi:hypothetical protein [Nocardia camponoti]|uniref:UsfY protein n=1 Tax=Nocardia camponoti TaxID=1616106 RepID=A0A917Q7A1_9NOCA|nr:hypothetical protein [Nocardia camponoti]GGK32745.1 hypothetical protein GCM10011591_00570 [Nocardia camponoti]